MHLLTLNQAVLNFSCFIFDIFRWGKKAPVTVEEQTQTKKKINMELQEFRGVVVIRIPFDIILNLEKAPGNRVKTPSQTKEAQRQQPEEKRRRAADNLVTSRNIH